jgi:hypothetical protein
MSCGEDQDHATGNDIGEEGGRGIKALQFFYEFAET